MWSAAVFEPAFPRPEEGRDRLAGSARAVVDEGRQRMVAVGLLPGRGRILLVGVRNHEDSVKIGDDLTVGVRGVLTGQRPDTVTDFGACGPDRLQGLLAGGGEGVDQAGDGRIEGDRTEDGWLGPQHGDIREAVPAQCDRQGDIQEYLAGIVDGPRLAPRRQSLGNDLVKTGLADRFDEQNRTGLGDDLAAVVLDADTGIGPDRVLHLGSASGGGRNKDLDNPHSCWSEALSAFLPACRTARLMKARG